MNSSAPPNSPIQGTSNPGKEAFALLPGPFSLSRLFISPCSLILLGAGPGERIFVLGADAGTKRRKIRFEDFGEGRKGCARAFQGCKHFEFVPGMDQIKICSRARIRN